MNSLSRSFFFVKSYAKHNPGPMAKLAMLCLLVAPGANADWVGDARAMMGTEISVYLWSDNPEMGMVTVEAVFQEAARIDRLMSTYKDESKNIGNQPPGRKTTGRCGS